MIDIVDRLLYTAVWAWVIVVCLRRYWPLAITITAEMRPFMPAVYVGYYLVASHVNDGPDRWAMVTLVFGMISWWFSRHDDDDRWKRRRRRLAARVRVAAGGRSLTTEPA